jgi:hypothetical protein
MTKKFKDIVKQNPEPARGKSGTSPMDPWNAKSGLAEASEQQLLHRYLKSRGMNPEFIAKDTKISHSKSSAFLSWRKAHEFDESVEILEATDEADTISLDIPLMIRMLELAREDVKDDMELHRITERLIEIRNKGTLTMDDYEFIAGIKKLKEELEGLSEKKEVNEVKKVKMTSLDKWRAAADERERKHNEIERERQEKLHQQPPSENMSSAIDRLEKHLKNKVVFERIDEISKTTLSSYRDKARTSLKTAQTNRDAAEPGKDMSKGFADLHAKSNMIAKKRVKGLMGYMQRKQGMKPTSENTLDAKAATEAPVGPGEIATEAQKQRSKSARMIKNLYKKKNMKEETYDWEKDDKTPQKLGKGVKIEIPKKEANFGENKPEARIVMSGGKTMTGEKRDTVEVDPLMANRPNTPDQFDKPNKK